MENAKGQAEQSTCLVQVRLVTAASQGWKLHTAAGQWCSSPSPPPPALLLLLSSPALLPFIVVNQIYLIWVFFLVSSLLMYRNITDFCVLIFVSRNFTEFICSNKLFGRALRVSICKIMLPAKRGISVSSLLSWILFKFTFLSNYSG